MVSNAFGTDLVQLTYDVVGLLLISIILALGLRLKKLIDRHLDAQEAILFNSVVNGLSQLADVTIHSFNQEVITQKTNRTFTAETAKSIKQSAVNAVLSQGSNLISLAKDLLPEIEALVGNLIEKAVANHKVKRE